MNDAIFNALADPNRRKILEILAKDLRARPSRQLYKHIPETKSAISYHLKVLLNAGLIHVSVSGKSWLYFFDPKNIDLTAAYLQAITAHANAALQGPAAHMLAAQRNLASKSHLTRTSTTSAGR